MLGVEPVLKFIFRLPLKTEFVPKFLQQRKLLYLLRPCFGNTNSIVCTEKAEREDTERTFCEKINWLRKSFMDSPIAKCPTIDKMEAKLKLIIKRFCKTP